MVMRARKKYVVIAYDISQNKRRRKVEKAVKKYGGRVNLSVFECMLTESQLGKLQGEIEKALDLKTDQVAYYTLCMDCFSAIVYQPERRRGEGISSTTVV